MDINDADDRNEDGTHLVVGRRGDLVEGANRAIKRGRRAECLRIISS